MIIQILVYCIDRILDMTEEVIDWLEQHHPSCPNPHNYPQSAQWYIDMMIYLQQRKNQEST